MQDRKNIINSKSLEKTINNSDDDRIKIKDLVESMNDVGFSLVLLIFSFGIIIPSPPPFPSIISLPLVIFSWQMFLGYKSPKLPKKFANITVKRKVVATILQKAIHQANRFDKILIHRADFMFSNNGERIIGLFSLILSSFILMPMPLSNFIPGVGIFIISLGMLKKDGIAVIVGIVIGLSGITIALTVTIKGIEFFTNIFIAIKGLIM
jgi:hypothetical protein